MKTSEQIDQLAMALASAQANIKSASKNAVNPQFRSKYADLASIIDSAREGLSPYGLCFIQSPVFGEGGRVTVVTRILHKSGQWIENEVSLKPGQDTPQAMGSAITYGRRYGLSAILGIAADEDDDANGAQPVKSPVITKAMPLGVKG